MPLVKVSGVAGAVHHLRAGHLVIYPTETAYALGADATNAHSVQAIFRCKGRRRGKSLPLIVGSLAMAERVGRLNALARRLGRRYWPGALTLVVPSRRRLPRGVVAANGTVALRLSSHPVARRLSRGLGQPVVATSANRSGRANSYSVRALTGAFGRQRETVYLLSAGTLPRRPPSTIVRPTNFGLQILRQGSVRVSIV